MNDKSTTRSPLLTALLLLTFIGSSIGFIGYFLASLFFDKTTELIIKYSSWNSVEIISPIYFTILMALSAISLSGAIRMWKFHLDGFFIYASSQVLLLFVPVIWINGSAFSVANAIATGIFIIGYLLTFKWQK